MFYFELLILITTLSLDTLIAGISMGIEKIKVPFSSIFILNIISTFFLLISCLLGSQILNLFSYKIINYLPSIIFILLGISKLLEPICKSKSSKGDTLKPSNIECIFQIYQNPLQADLDDSKTLSIKELVLLSVALSLDNFIVGIGLIHYISFLFLIVIFHFLFGIIGFYFCNHISLRVNISNKINTSIMSGLIFILVGIFQIIF